VEEGLRESRRGLRFESESVCSWESSGNIARGNGRRSGSDALAIESVLREDRAGRYGQGAELKKNSSGGYRINAKICPGFSRGGGDRMVEGGIGGRIYLGSRRSQRERGEKLKEETQECSYFKSKLSGWRAKKSRGNSKRKGSWHFLGFQKEHGGRRCA